MSNVSMPEPVAWAHFTEDGLIQIWSRRKDDVESLERLMGKPPNGVITTTQAQAYADARVREALEVMAVEAHQACINYCNGHATNFEDELKQAIRALIPT